MFRQLLTRISDVVFQALREEIRALHATVGNLQEDIRALHASADRLREQNDQLLKRVADAELHNAGMHAALLNIGLENTGVLRGVDRYMRSINATLPQNAKAATESPARAEAGDALPRH